MKRVLIIAGVVMVLSACNQNGQEKTEDNEKHNVKVEQLATTKDFVCGMDIDRDDMIADTMMYEGKIYGFCDPGCKEEFAKNPESYLTQNQE